MAQNHPRDFQAVNPATAKRCQSLVALMHACDIAFTWYKNRLGHNSMLDCFYAQDLSYLRKILMERHVRAELSDFAFWGKQRLTF